MVNAITLPFLRRSRLKSPMYQSGSNASHTWRDQSQTIYVHVRKGSVLEFSILNGITCPICSTQHCTDLDLLRAHVSCLHPHVDFHVKIKSETKTELIAEAWINYDSVKPVLSRASEAPERSDALCSGEERCLKRGKFVVRKRIDSPSTGAAKHWKTGATVQKRRKIVNKSATEQVSSNVYISSQLEVSSQSTQPHLSNDSSAGQIIVEDITVTEHSTDDVSQTILVESTQPSNHAKLITEDVVTSHSSQDSSNEHPELDSLRPRTRNFLRKHCLNRDSSPATSLAESSASAKAASENSRTSSVENQDPYQDLPRKYKSSSLSRCSVNESFESTSHSVESSYELRSRKIYNILGDVTLSSQSLRELHSNDTPITNSPVASQIFNDVARRRKRHFKVPKPPKGVSFFSSATKRLLRPGEYLTDSDDEVDESWREVKTNQIIDSTDGQSPAAKEFMKKWNAHFNTENLPGDQFFADAFLRFVAQNIKFLRRKDVKLEFKKLRDNLEAEDLLLDTHIIRTNFVFSLPGLPGPRLQHMLRSSNHGTRCICGEDVIDACNAITCSNELCPNPEHHMTCVGLTERLDTWLCETCQPP